ncbi:hypothetical protein HRbin16_00967 [bacterium HR16]|nr:hypothetical protein HRbin16_00967 [bacterium HR16]
MKFGVLSKFLDKLFRVPYSNRSTLEFLHVRQFTVLCVHALIGVHEEEADQVVHLVSLIQNALQTSGGLHAAPTQADDEGRAKLTTFGKVDCAHDIILYAFSRDVTHCSYLLIMKMESFEQTASISTLRTGV